MKKILFLIIICIIVSSCTVQKSTVSNVDLIANQKYDPATMKPRNFDETEIWFDYHHNKPLIEPNL